MKPSSFSSIKTAGRTKSPLTFRVQAVITKDKVVEFELKHNKRTIIALCKTGRDATIYRQKLEEGCMYIAEPGAFNADLRKKKYSSPSTHKYNLWIYSSTKIKPCPQTETGADAKLNSKTKGETLKNVLTILSRENRKNLKEITINNVELLDGTAHCYWACSSCKTRIKGGANDNGEYSCSKPTCGRTLKMDEISRLYRISGIQIRQNSAILESLVCFHDTAVKIIGKESTELGSDYEATEMFQENISDKKYTIRISGKRCEQRYGNYWNLCLLSLQLEDSVEAAGTSGAAASRQFSEHGLVPVPQTEETPQVNMEEPENSQVKVITAGTGELKIQTQGPEIYKMDSKPRGSVLIISNVKFPGDHHRHGGLVDEKKVFHLFKNFGFKVVPKKDVKSEEDLDRIIRDFKSKLSTNTDCSVVVGMSHGSDREFQLINGHCINFWEKVIYEFSVENCPVMQGKPKLFFVNTCQEFAQNRPTPARELTPHNYSDIFVVCAALPGFPAHRYDSGTIFIHCLVNVFENNAFNTELQKLLRMVQRKMKTHKPDIKQTALFTPIDFGEFYFNIEPKNNES